MWEFWGLCPHTLYILEVNLNDINISSDVSLFTIVPIRDTLSLLHSEINDNTIRLFHHVLTSSFFSFSGLVSSMNKWMELPWPHLCHLHLPTLSWRTRTWHSAGQPTSLHSGSITWTTHLQSGLMDQKYNNFSEFSCN